MVGPAFEGYTVYPLCQAKVVARPGLFEMHNLCPDLLWDLH